MRRISLLLLAALLAHSSRGSAQVFDLAKDRLPVTALEGLARFHTGDDLQWAGAGFDDSSWPVLRLDRAWNGQGYQNYSGFAWYRFRIVPRQDGRRLALFIPYIEGPYEVYANGACVGRVGGLPRKPVLVEARNLLFSLPAVNRDAGPSLVIAIRVWLSPRWTAFAGGPGEALLVGDADWLRNWRELQIRSILWELSANDLELTVFFIVGFAGLFLFLLRREEREYLWFAAYQIIAATSLLEWNLRLLHTVPFDLWLTGNTLLESSYRICLLEFVRQTMKAPRGRLYFTGVAAMALNVLLLIPSESGWIGDSQSILLQVLVFLPYYACVLILLYRGARAGERDGRFLFAPMALWFLSDAIINSALAMSEAGHPWAARLLDRLLAITAWPFRMALNDIAFLLFEASVLCILLLRFVRSRREEEKLKAEFEAASLVQQVIVPTENPAIPGFRIETFYKPAGEVGGDFFQIVPDPKGGALIAVGDVSGKGLPAAMTVSLLIGTFRTLAHYTHCPGEILSAMNHRMIGRSRGGFTTCLVLRAGPDGLCTVANAGHLAPYRKGEELSVDSGIPLGLDADAGYGEITFELPVGVQLVLLTDGVVEARNSVGELFGFERTRAISTESAERIAGAARQFGQQDDITVLVLSRTATSPAG